MSVANKTTEHLLMLKKKLDKTVRSLKVVSETRDAIVLEIENGDKSDISFNVVNLDGIVVRQTTSKGNILTVEKNNLAPSFYFIRSTNAPFMQFKINVY
jgi:hypothetical protein